MILKMLNSLKKVFVNSFSRVKEKSLSYIRKPSFVLFSILFSVFFYNLLVKERFVLHLGDEAVGESATRLVDYGKSEIFIAVVCCAFSAVRSTLSGHMKNREETTGIKSR